MGILRFFKKRRRSEVEDKITTQENRENTISDNGQSVLSTGIDSANSNKLFEFFVPYSVYALGFISNMLKGNYAPIGAFSDINGNVTGFLFFGNSSSDTMSVADSVEKMKSLFEDRIKNNKINSYVIFYHSNIDGEDCLEITEDIKNLNGFSVICKSKNGLANRIRFPYFLENDSYKFKGFNDFSKEQNGEILSFKPDPQKDYFQEKIEIKSDVEVNEFGIKIKQVNNGTLGDMWGGILGFSKLKESSQILIEYSAFVISRPPRLSTTEISISDVTYDDVVFRGVQKNDKSSLTIYPVVKNNNFIAVENKIIAEWSNVKGLEAVVGGECRETFGVNYFATDYAENRTIYHSNKNVNISFSGILFNINHELENNKTLPGGANLSEDFVGFTPHQELAQFGCYNFVGLLEDYKEIHLLDDSSACGYILTLKLINYDGVKDFFTIPMFLNKENMNFNEIQNGNRYNGTFQLLGEIKNELYK